MDVVFQADTKRIVQLGYHRLLYSYFLSELESRQRKKLMIMKSLKLLYGGFDRTGIDFVWK